MDSGLGWAVSSCGSTVDVVRAAVPVGLRAATSRAFSSLTLFGDILGGKLDQRVDSGLGWAVSSCGSAVDVVWAAIPVGLRAATSRTFSSFTLVGDILGGKLDDGIDSGLGWAVSSCGSTVDVVRAAVPVGLWAATSRAFSSLTLFGDIFGGKLDQGVDSGLGGAVSSCGSAVDVVWAAIPVGLRAATSRAFSSLTLFGDILGGKLDDGMDSGLCWAVSSCGSTVDVVWAAIPVGLRAATSRTFSSFTLVGDILGGKLNDGIDSGLGWAVSSCGSAVDVVWAAVPVGLRAATSRAFCSLTLVCSA